MILQNIYDKNKYIEYDIDIDNIHRQYDSMYAPFTDRFCKWHVTILKSCDMIYMPGINNRSRNIYVVTWDYISGVDKYGIYTMYEKWQ